MADSAAAWEAELAGLRRRVETLRAAVGRPEPLVGAAGRAALARVRREARPLFEAVARAYDGLCPSGFPVLEDNGIAGPGGSIGVRFSPKHVFFVALEHAKKRPPAEPGPARLAGALGVRLKRLPGQPLPPPDPHARFELVVLGLRWDDDRGWVEVRRPLDSRWDQTMLQDHLTAYLLGLNYDVAAGLEGVPESQ
jgi:hypothetical protein